MTLQWRHNERDGVSNHRRLDCFLNSLFRRRSKKTSKRRATGLCEGNSPLAGEFPARRTINAENVSIWWRHLATQVAKTPMVLTSFSLNISVSTLEGLISSRFFYILLSVCFLCGCHLLCLFVPLSLFLLAHICMNRLMNGLDEGLSPTQYQAITWMEDNPLLIRT